MPEVGRGHRPLARPGGEAQRAGQNVLAERRARTRRPFIKQRLGFWI